MASLKHTWYHHPVGLLLVILAIVNARDDLNNCNAYYYGDDGTIPEDSRPLYWICKIAILFFHPNFNNLHPNRSLGLTVECDQIVPGNLYPDDFSSFTQLRELRIQGCLVQNLSAGVFNGIHHLEQLVVSDDISTFSSIPPITRVLAPNLFAQLPMLELLDFSYSGLESIPTSLLCDVPKIYLLALGYNKLVDLEDIGCGAENACCQNLQELNLTFNRIEQITSKAFKYMSKLEMLDLGGNNIRVIESGSFANLSSLVLINLQFNKLQVLPRGLFKSNTVVQYILLDHNLITELPDDLFHGLHNLAFLKLNDNMISHLPCCAFKDLYNLLVLDISINQIVSIPEHFFFPMTNMHSMSWSDNKISSFQNTNLDHLLSLRYFNFSRNNLDVIPDYFDNFTNMEVLDISENSINSFPSFNTLKNLTLLNLADNEIRQFKKGLVLTGKDKELHLAKNHFQKLPTQQMNISSVQILLVNNCDLTTLEGINISCPSLTELYAQNNQLADLNQVVDSMTNLKVLHVSHNNIRGTFEFSVTIPLSLEKLDLSHNRITKLGNTWVKKFHLKNLCASFNLIRFVKSTDFPTSLETIDLSSNQIVELGENTFGQMPNLQVVNLQLNKLTILSSTWFRFYGPASGRPPLINMDYNFLECDCTNTWTLMQMSGKWYPLIQKVSFCTVTQQRMRNFKRILYYGEVTKDQFFCTADRNNNQACVPNCSCYFTEDRHFYQVDCGNYDGVWLFDQFPNETSHIFLDGVRSVPFNRLRRTEPYKFMVALFLNSSNILDLPDDAFLSFPNLVELHLENNQLEKIPPSALNGLHKLQQLYLHSNLLSQFDFSILMYAPLRLLTLHYNELRTLHGFNSTRTIRDITLYNNSLECSCDYVPELHQWILDWEVTVDNINNTYCTYQNNDEVPLLSFNKSSCFSVTKYEKHRNPSDITLMALLITSGCLITVFILLAGVYLYREELLVYLYARFGIRLFYKNNEVRTDKQFDAFICYSHKDEDFVANKLVPNMQDVGYRLCLHEQNFVAGRYIIESVIEAVQVSCRTILVLSPSFVESDWCRFEFKMAHQQSLRDRMGRILVLILEDVPDEQMEPELRLYLRTNTYLKWEDKNFWNKLKFALPDLGDVVPQPVA